LCERKLWHNYGTRLIGHSAKVTLAQQVVVIKIDIEPVAADRRDECF